MPRMTAHPRRGNRKPRVALAALLVLAAVAVAVFGLGLIGCAPRDAGFGNSSSSTSAAVSRPAPQLDGEVPAKLETATFALG